MEEIEIRTQSDADVSRLVMLCSIPHFLNGVRRMNYFGSGDALSAVLVLSIIEANLRHPALAPVAAWLADHVPADQRGGG